MEERTVKQVKRSIGLTIIGILFSIFDDAPIEHILYLVNMVLKTTKISGNTNKLQKKENDLVEIGENKIKALTL